MNNPVVISVGGSLIVPDGVNTLFLKAFRTFILERLAEGETFVIIAGGGKLARRYMDAGSDVLALSNDELDWLGIHATRLNAYLMRAIFHEYAHPEINTDPNIPVPRTHKIVIAGGWKPGRSTDYDAVLLAKQVGARRVINLSNIDYAYTADPKKNPDAKPIERITWPEFRKLLPEKWNPGLSTPFDPIAAEEIESLGFEVALINGERLGEVKKYLSGKSFVGTIIL